MNGIELGEDCSWFDPITFMIEINHKRIDLWIGRLFWVGGFLVGEFHMTKAEFP
jgi:hypothetical protein